MARPTKRGLDYFPMDCIQDDNLTFIEAKHGIEGFGILVKIWQKIYRHDGYYMRWNEQNMYLFAREIAVNMDVISSVVNTCLLPNIAIFNEGMLEKYGILTSTGIQKRWVSIVKSSKRKDVEIEAKYDLLSFTPVETELTPEETKVYTSESTQTKVNESKLNETTQNEIKNLCALEENEDVETGKEILKDFGFNEISNPDKLRTVVDFLFIQKNGGRRDFFLKQYDAYKKYKDLALEKKHNFLTFFGNQQNRFEDGKWLEVNWEFKLAEEIKKVNQKANPIAENRGVVAAMSSYQRLKR